jgi:hypothetical protein
MHVRLNELVRPFAEDLARTFFRDIVLGLEFRMVMTISITH